MFPISAYLLPCSDWYNYTDGGIMEGFMLGDFSINKQKADQTNYYSTNAVMLLNSGNYLGLSVAILLTPYLTLVE